MKRILLAYYTFCPLICFPAFAGGGEGVTYKLCQSFHRYYQLWNYESGAVCPNGMMSVVPSM